MEEKPLQMLLVEDNPGDARLLQELLTEVASPRFGLTRVGRLDQALQHLQRIAFDVILLDLLLPDAQGLEGLAKVQVRAPRVPVVVLTGVDDEGLAVKAVRLGAQDYLVKGQFDGYLLSRALCYAVERKEIESEIQRHREVLAELVEERTFELRQANEDLQREVEERKRAEKQIRAALCEKEVLLQELHDRVKNNLQVISSLLDMQAAYTAEPEARHLLRESQNRVRALAFAQDTLYQQADLATIDLASYVHTIVSYLVEVYGNLNGAITVDVQVGNFQLDLEAAANCGMIINELTSNALQHAFPADWHVEKGLIRVEICAQGNGDCTLIVSDNGVGLGPGLDLQNPQSLGLRLVTMLAGQLGGVLEVDRRGGTAFKISFPPSSHS
jgi:two-component sensor histidine kinase/CheY-like chemotaxis protein